MTDYVGFLIFSRTECSATLVREIGEGADVRFGVMQKDNAGVEVYQNFYKYLRWIGSETARRSATFQFSRLLAGAEDSRANTKKDNVWVTISGISEAAMAMVRNDAFMDNCLKKVQVGVMIPSGDVQFDYDHARCVGEQKAVGF